MFYDIKPLLLYLTLHRGTGQGNKCLSPTVFMKAKKGGLFSKYTLEKLTAINWSKAKLFGERLTLLIIHSAIIGSSKGFVELFNSADSHCAIESNQLEKCNAMFYCVTKR